MQFTKFIDIWMRRAGWTAAVLVAAVLAYFAWPTISANETHLGIYQGGCAVFGVLFTFGFIVDIWRGRFYKILYVVGLTVFWPVFCIAVVVRWAVSPVLRKK